MRLSCQTDRYLLYTFGKVGNACILWLSVCGCCDGDGVRLGAISGGYDSVWDWQLNLERYFLYKNVINSKCFFFLFFSSARRHTQESIDGARRGETVGEAEKSKCTKIGRNT